jgi:hypothetical protein
MPQRPLSGIYRHPPKYYLGHLAAGEGHAGEAAITVVMAVDSGAQIHAAKG